MNIRDYLVHMSVSFDESVWLMTTDCAVIHYTEHKHIAHTALPVILFSFRSVYSGISCRMRESHIQWPLTWWLPGSDYYIHMVMVRNTVYWRPVWHICYKQSFICSYCCEFKLLSDLFVAALLQMIISFPSKSQVSMSSFQQACYW